MSRLHLFFPRRLDPVPVLTNANSSFFSSSSSFSCFLEFEPFRVIFVNKNLNVEYPFTSLSFSRDSEKSNFPGKGVGRGGWRGGIFITRVYGDNSRPRPVFSSKFYSPLSLSLSPSLFYSRAGEGCNEARTRPREYLGPTIAIPRIGTIRPWPGKRHASDNPISE